MNKKQFVLKPVKWLCPGCGAWLPDASNLQHLYAHMYEHLRANHPQNWCLRSIR